jgi:hypothetical protein
MKPKVLPALTGSAAVIEVYVSLLEARERDVRLYFNDEKTEEEGRIWLLPGPLPK